MKPLVPKMTKMAMAAPRTVPAESVRVLMRRPPVAPNPSIAWAYSITPGWRAARAAAGRPRIGG
ncbi:hypothetical protein SAT01_15170 [Sinomonas atrocyanea]|nr:hypothetical protein SAT01_15170 [Sinomonas atrocyanea]GGG67766.1 hypothetical protein GCM10007172_19500 [Sinomonas atrocyanea]